MASIVMVKHYFLAIKALQIYILYYIERKKNMI